MNSPHLLIDWKQLGTTIVRIIWNNVWIEKKSQINGIDFKKSWLHFPSND